MVSFGAHQSWLEILKFDLLYDASLEDLSLHFRSHCPQAPQLSLFWASGQRASSSARPRRAASLCWSREPSAWCLANNRNPQNLIPRPKVEIWNGAHLRRWVHVGDVPKLSKFRVGIWKTCTWWGSASAALYQSGYFRLPCLSCSCLPPKMICWPIKIKNTYFFTLKMTRVHRYQLKCKNLHKIQSYPYPTKYCS